MTRTRVGLAIAAAAFLFAFAAGCEEEQAQGPDIIKKHRLIASENLRMKEEMKTLNKQIEDQNEQLAKCQQERHEWQDKAGEGMKKEIDKMVMISKSAEDGLQQEIARLNAEIAKLKGEPNAPAEQPKENIEQPKTEEGQTAAPPSEEKPQGSEQSQPPAVPQ